MDTYNYVKHVLSRATNYTFSRMTFYLTLFNFFLLSQWMYDNTSFGSMLQDAGMRPGDTLLIILFIIFALSALEYVVIGRGKEKEREGVTEE
jgi:hypothetical protein